MLLGLLLPFSLLVLAPQGKEGISLSHPTLILASKNYPLRISLCSPSLVPSSPLPFTPPHFFVLVNNHQLTLSHISVPISFLTMSTVTDFDLLACGVDNLTVQDQGKMKGVMEGEKGCLAIPCHHGICAICLDKIVLQETALLKGCEHAYCVTCILRWASYNEHPKCPQCKNPFESLHVHRSLDGSLQDYMLEESVCLLLRATWFKPLVVVHQDEPYDEFADVYQYVYEEEYIDVEEDDDDLEETYFNNSSAGVRIGNRRWGDNGFVRSGRQEARPVHRSNIQDTGAGSSREPSNKKEVGRRAKRALKREAADKAAAAKHQQHLVRMGRK